MHKRQQTKSIKATLMPNMKFAVNDNGIMADKKNDFFFKISAHISVIKSTIRAATPASIPFKTAASIVLETTIL